MFNFLQFSVRGNTFALAGLLMKKAFSLGQCSAKSRLSAFKECVHVAQTLSLGRKIEIFNISNAAQ